MAIQNVTSPPLLDETGQDIVDSLQAIANAVNSNAGQIDYSNTTSHLSATKVQGAIDEVKGITDTISANLAQLVSVQQGTATYGVNSTIQLNSDILNHSIIVINLARYGYGGSIVLIKDAITAGFYSSGIGAYINSSRNITIKVDGSGLITILATHDDLNISILGIA